MENNNRVMTKKQQGPGAVAANLLKAHWQNIFRSLSLEPLLKPLLTNPTLEPLLTHLPIGTQVLPNQDKEGKAGTGDPRIIIELK